MGPVGLAQGVCFAATASCAGAMGAIAWLDLGGERAVLSPVRRVALAAGTIAVVSHCAVLVGRAGEMLEKGVIALTARDYVLIVGHTWFGKTNGRSSMNIRPLRFATPPEPPATPRGSCTPIVRRSCTPMRQQPRIASACRPGT